MANDKQEKPDSQGTDADQGDKDAQVNNDDGGNDGGNDAEEDFEHKYKRALADYQNLLKRTTQEKEEFHKYAHEGFILEILPVYDNLKISLAHIDETAQANGWAEGIKHVVKQFKDVLSGLGVEEIEAEGKEFNPHVMEALEGGGSTVKQVVKPGYVLKGRVIVPAKVILEND